MSDEECEYAKDHPAIDRTLQELERRLDRVESMMDQKVDGLHERITELATSIASARGWMAGFTALGTIAGGLIVFVLNRMFHVHIQSP